MTSPSLDHKSIQDDGTEIFQSHYWRRVFATDIRCGDSTDVKISTKAGVSETLLAEAAGALEIAVPVLKSTLSPKVSQSNTISQERVIEFTRKLSASKCRGLTFAEWQKTERITIRRPRRLSHLRFHEQTRHIDNRTESSVRITMITRPPNVAKINIRSRSSRGLPRYTQSFLVA